MTAFTHKLSYDEQRALSAEEFGAYCDWLFGANESVCRRREREQRFPNRDWDKERAIRLDEDYDTTPQQIGGA